MQRKFGRAYGLNRSPTQKRLKRRRLLWLASLLVVCLVAGTTWALLGRTSQRLPQAAPGNLRPTWSKEIDAASVGYSPSAHLMLLWYHTGGVTLSPTHLIALDARTGVVRWRDQLPPNWDVSVDYLQGDPVVGDTLLVQVSNPDRQEVYFAGLNVSNGQPKWVEPLVDADAEVGRSGSLAVANESQRTVRAVSVTDGKTAWQWEAPAGCTVTYVRARDELIGAETLCAGETRYLSRLSSTGAQLWKVPLRGGDAAAGPNWEPHGNVFQVWSGGQNWAYNQDGKQIFFQPNVTGEFHATSIGKTALFSYGEPNSGTLVGVDLTSGRKLWSRRLKVDDFLIDHGSVYLVGSMPEPLMPHFLASLDVRGGAVALSGMPPFGTVMGVDRGHLFVEVELNRFAAYRIGTAGSGFLGGADVKQWPDACTLVTAAQVNQAMSADAYHAVKDRALVVAGQRLPNSPRCRFLATSKDPTVDVAVGWVAGTPSEAVQYLRLLNATTGERVSGLGDEGYIVPQTAGQDMVEVMFRVGPRVARLRVQGQQPPKEPAIQLARVVASHLKTT
jgi:hypothetical protein